jgi:hypothetical protein
MDVLTETAAFSEQLMKHHKCVVSQCAHLVLHAVCAKKERLGTKEDKK